MDPPANRLPAEPHALLRASFARAGFTLVELLSVMAIAGIILTLGALALTGIKGAGDVTRSAYQASGALEIARTYAIGNSTYTWVGFFEEDAAQAPGTEGTGRIVMSIVASKDGSRLYASDDLNPPPLDPTRLVNVGNLIKLANMHLEVLPSAAVQRPAITNVDPAAYQVGSPSFAQRSGPPSMQNNTTFTYPLNDSAPVYTFTKILQFNPQGDCSKIVDSPSRLVEIGLRQTHGNAADGTSTNLVAIQATGIGGNVKIYRP